MDALSRSPVFLGLVLVFVLAEYLWRARLSGRGYDVGAAGASFAIALGNTLLKPLTGVVMGAVYLAVWEIAPVHLPVDDWRVWVAAFFVMEFAYYWFHRWSHTVRWLWASHAVHHSATEMTFPAAIRLGWTGLISCGWLVFAPVILIGFHPLIVAALFAANLGYQFFLHTEAVGKLGPLEWVLNTPSHHRAHHASNPRYIDRNFGGVLIVFDRLFGTFVEESAEEKLRYGLAHPLTSRNPFAIAFHEWGRMARDVRAAPDWKTRGRALFGRPPA